MLLTYANVDILAMISYLRLDYDLVMTLTFLNVQNEDIWSKQVIRSPSGVFKLII